MSTRWETLVGDTSRFAIKMGFIEDDSNVAMEPEMAASWGSLELWVEGKNLCAHVEEGETLDAVHWYLLPLLEWLAANWNALLHEERLPIRNAGEDAVDGLYRTRFAPDRGQRATALDLAEHWYAWRQRHGFHTAREGGLFPEFYIRRWEDELEISWSNQAPAGAPEAFSFLVPYGRARLATDDVAQPLHAVAQAAIEQLVAWEPESPRLASLKAQMRDLKKPRKQRDERLDWLFDLQIEGTNGDRPWTTVRDLFSRTTGKIRRAVFEPEGSGLVLRGSSHAVLLFGSVSPTISASDARSLAELLIKLFDDGGDPPQLASLVDDAGSDPLEGLPWEQGYDLADRVHQVLGLAGDGAIDIDATLGGLGIHLGTVTLTDPRIRGISIAGPQHRPSVFVNEEHPRNKSEEGRRFTLAHEFCHLIVDRRIGKKLAVASGHWAPLEIEKRANAFAAYFLMPPDRVQAAVAALPVQVESSAGVRGVAEALRTSHRATLEHLHNLGWLDEFQRDMLRGTGLDDETFDRESVGFGG